MERSRSCAHEHATRLWQWKVPSSGPIPRLGYTSKTRALKSFSLNLGLPMTVSRRLVVVAVCALACRNTTPAPTAPDRAIAPDGMPSLERRAIALADSDLADEHYWPMGVSDAGNIVFLASGTQQPMFRVVDSTGRRLQAFGRQGDGPGEFRGPIDLQTRGDSLRIFDGRRMTLLRYTWEGRPIGESRALMLDIPLAWIGDSVDHWVPPAMTRTERSVIRRTLVGDSAGRVVIAEQDSGAPCSRHRPAGST